MSIILKKSLDAHKRLYKYYKKKGNTRKATYHDMCYREQLRGGSLLSHRAKKEIYDFCMR